MGPTDFVLCDCADGTDRFCAPSLISLKKLQHTKLDFEIVLLVMVQMGPTDSVLCAISMFPSGPSDMCVANTGQAEHRRRQGDEDELGKGAQPDA